MTGGRGDGLVCVLENDYPVSVVRATGPMSIQSVPALRRVVHKCFADHPALLLIDVSAVVLIDDVTVSVFATLAYQGGALDVAVMLVAPTPALAAQLQTMGVGRSMPVHASEEEARADFDQRPAPWRLQVALDPVPSATAAARDLTDQACARWQLRDLADAASLIATELVANAIQHAGTPIRFVLTWRSSYLHLACRDRSPAAPRLGGVDEESRGLLIIESIATSWGFTPTLDGKVVWATVRTRR
jgi:anti-anti-sigma factor